MIRVFIADDHAIIREGLARIIHETDDIELAGQAEECERVLTLAPDADWDVLILDLSLPGGGAETLQRLQYIRPQLPVIIFSMHPEDQYAIQLLKSGASAYLTKGRATEEMIAAIRTVARGERYVTQNIAAQLLFTNPTSGHKPHELLSARESQVFMLILDGKQPSDIVSELNISPSTVSTHIQNVKKKLGASSIVELVKYAYRSGILS